MRPPVLAAIERTSAAIAADPAVEWAEAHSPVGCTVRGAPAYVLETEVV